MANVHANVRLMVYQKMMIQIGTENTWGVDCIICRLMILNTVRFLRKKYQIGMIKMAKSKKKGKGPSNRKVIEREFPYSLEKAGCEIERLTIGEKYMELVFLIPVRADIKQALDKVINECNQYGNFLSQVFTITNVKELSAEEVEEIIKKNGGNSQASH